MPQCRAILLMMSAFAFALLSGCVTSAKYYMAPAETPPAVPLDITATSPPLDLTVATVIVYQGPGSWKQEAMWDEYVISLTNRGTVPLWVQTALLADPTGELLAPGAEPWALEKVSEANWKRYGRVGMYVLGAGAAGQTLGYGLLGMGAGVSVLYVAVPLALVANVVVVGVMNRNNKRAIAVEFDRRRLRLPRRLEPGAAMHGSLFFPVVPQPQRLVVRGTTAEAPLELTLGLGALSALHVKPLEQQ